ncbi:class I glutamine amidotransferase-like protein [Dipodascopsis tothii]|uniref:class I glutamine amidotransferase-like protein n=1 Tax=Dipodascopsis tothii TaxID=44089 RepID=UPI0034D00C3C
MPSIAQPGAEAPARKFTLAVLETDPEMQTVEGSMRELVTQWVGRADAADRIAMPSFDVRRAPAKYPDPAAIDGVLITGSRADAHADDDWILHLLDYVRELATNPANAHVRIVGICFGHQIVARALGGSVVKNPLGWELSATTLELSPAGQALFPAAAGGLVLHEMHQDHVDRAPPGVDVIASSPTSPVQGLYRADKLLTFQGHPEFSGDVTESLSEIVRQKGDVDDATADDAIARTRVRDHGPYVGQRVVADFLLRAQA